MRVPKPQRVANESVLQAARDQPCVACGRAAPSDPAHVRSRGAGGDDTENNVMPLCREHHREQHARGWISMSVRYPSVDRWLSGHGWQSVEKTLKGIR